MKKTPKSKKYIINAFIELRKSKPIEKITVMELCEKADINKSTFYTYYHDIYDLSDQLEEEIMKKILECLPSPEIIVKHPAEFTRQLMNGYNENRELISVLFSGSRSALLPERIEHSIKELFYSVYPEKRGDAETDITLTYKIYGGFYAFLLDRFDDIEKIEVICKLS